MRRQWKALLHVCASHGKQTLQRILHLITRVNRSGSHPASLDQDPNHSFTKCGADRAFLKMAMEG